MARSHSGRLRLPCKQELPSVRIRVGPPYVDIAQLVEHLFAIQKVASSSLVIHSNHGTADCPQEDERLPN